VLADEYVLMIKGDVGLSVIGFIKVFYIVKIRDELVDNGYYDGLMN
jgi:hypothetical protein